MRAVGKKAALGLVGLLLCCAFAARAAAEPESQELRRVVAEGVGAGKDKARARDEALSDAQRRAVEAGVGLYLKSETVAKNMTLLQDTILAHSSGYVHKYDVLAERYEDDLCRVKIRAEVRAGKLQEDLDDIAERLKIAGNPRVVVLLEPSSDAKASLAQSVLIEKLTGQGFKILDAEQLAAAQRKNLLPLRDARVIRRMQGQVEIIIVGKVTARPLGKLDETLSAYFGEARVEARAVRTDTAEVIAGTPGTTERPQTGLAGQEQATEKALRAAAEDWIQKNLGALVKAVVDPAREYSLHIANCTQTDITALEDKLRGLRFTRQARLRSYTKGQAVFEVEYVGPAQAIRREISDFHRPTLVVETVTDRVLRGRLKRP